MNCKEAEALLSDYIDEALPPEQMETVAAHLAECDSCQGAFSDLAEAAKGVAGLPPINPPAGFSKRVMSKIREEEAKPGLWQRLFLAFKLNVPIQVTALFLVAGLAAYLYRANPLPQQNLGPPQSFDSRSASPLQPSLSEEAGGQSPGDRRMEQEAASPLGFAEVEERQESAPPTSDALSDASNGRKEGALEEEARFRVASPPDKMLSDASTPAKPSAAMAENENMDRAAELAESTASLKKQTLAADLEWILVPEPSTESQALGAYLAKRLEEMGGELQERLDRAGSAPKSDEARGETLWISLPKTQRDKLKRELAALGALDTGEQAAGPEALQSLPAEKSFEITLDENLPQSKNQVPLEQDPPLRIKLLIRAPQP